MKRTIIMVLGVILALALTTPMALAKVEQGTVASGKTEELAAAWTQWAYSKPEPQSPLIGEYEGGPRCDGTPVSPTPGNTWFLAGTNRPPSPTAEETKRTCTMPVGNRLFFPVYSATFFITENGETKEDALEFVTGRVDAVQKDPDLTIEVTVDGKEISNRIVRAQTPFFVTTLAEGNILDVPPGAYTTISEGLWVTLQTPLPPGEHTIHFEFSAPNVDLNPDIPGPEGRSQNNTYILTVVNRKPAP